MAQVIEGKWEDLAGRQDLQGRDVRVVVLEQGETTKDDPWLKALKAWVDSHAPVGHAVDDSRESIYSE